MTSQYLNETFDITINLSNAFLLRDEKTVLNLFAVVLNEKRSTKEFGQSGFILNRLEHKLLIISENRVFFYIEFETV